MSTAKAPASVVSLPAAAEMERVFRVQRAAYLRDNAPSAGTRIGRLERLYAAIERYEDEFVEAISADFGHRASVESRMLDVSLSLGDIKEARRHVREWMKPRRPGTRLHLMPARARLIPQPLGVVGVISAWNFPLYVTFPPAAAALAAGNRVMIKPSELSPLTSEVTARAMAEYFSEDEVAVINGGSDVGAAFASLPFDHMIFTGSTKVGRHIARAAAENLTPITLELGGKSPAVITPSADIGRAAEQLVYGKMVNAGQVCIAPDYVLCPRDRRDTVVAALRDAATKLFPTLEHNDDYTSVASDRHYKRLRGLVDDARDGGATIMEVNPASETLSEAGRKIPLTLVLDTKDEMKVMQEEIFGPLLPIVTYDSLDEAVRYINERDRPLALYVFADDSKHSDAVIHHTVSGGATVNDVLWHVANDTLPFGGVGASGMGAYHGQTGFDTFSHLKPVLYQPKLNATPLFYPPYGKLMGTLTKHFRRFL